jgi:hypothetical protein
MEAVLPSATFPSVAECFLFSGRTGRPPKPFGWSPVVPGDVGKEMGRNETRFLEKPPPGPRRRYAPKWPGSAKNPPDLPFHRGGKHIIGTGIVIVFWFPPDFFPGANSGVRATWMVHPSGSRRRRRSVTAFVRRGDPSGDRRNLIISSLVEIRERCCYFEPGPERTSLGGSACLGPNDSSTARPLSSTIFPAVGVGAAEPLSWSDDVLAVVRSVQGCAS